MGAACWRSRRRWRTPRSAKRRVQRVHASVAFRRDAEEDDVLGARSRASELDPTVKLA